MGPRRFVPFLVALVLVVTTFASAQARDGIHGTATVDVVPGGTGTVTSGNASVDQVDVDIILGTRALSDRPIFNLMAFTMMQVRSTRRVAACLMMASAIEKDERDDWSGYAALSGADVEGVANTRALAYAAMCLRIAKLMAEVEAEGPPTRARGRGCDVLPIDVKVKTERTEDGGYVVTPTSGARNATKRVGFKASCTASSGRITVHLHAKKGKTLRQVLAKQAQVGLANPTTSGGSAEVKVTFKTPR